MKKTEALSVGEIINQALQRAGGEQNYSRQQACYIWGDIVGQHVNRLTTRRWMEDDVLHVAITSAVVKNELSFSKEQLISAINRQLGAKVVSNIVFH